MGAMAPRPDNWNRVQAALPAAKPTSATPKTAQLRADDIRYRTLIGEAAWATLPEAIRKRFSKAVAPGDVTLYRGEVVMTELSLAGRVLAVLAKLIGAPLPAMHGARGPASVTVIEDPTLGGQTWTRVYPRPRRFPQVVHSAKRFRGATGLEEYVGSGIGMTLRLTVENGALVFRSGRYFFEAAGRRVLIPRALAPGEMIIVHTQEAGRRFSFRLTLTHGLFGRLIHQFALFEEV